MLRRIFIGAVLVLPIAVLAQQPDPIISMELSAEKIKIGEQVTITFLSEDSGIPLQWPVITDSLTQHLEVVRDLGVDTVLIDGTPYIHRDLVITSFDTGYWAIPPFQFIVGSATVELPAKLLQVVGVDLDPNIDLKAIHDQDPVPFELRFWLRDNWYWFVLTTALIIGSVLLLRALKRKPKTERIVAPVEVPITERYINALRELEAKRLWQQGQHKEYQSGITDLLRGYLEERYKVPAMERTTEELLNELKVSALDRDKQTQLGNLLRLADMVKFAKALPAPAENEQMMTEAIRFIQDTAPVVVDQNFGSHVK